MTVFQALIMLTGVTLFTRLGPLVGSNWLRRQPWIKRVSTQLPGMLLVLLLFHQMEGYIVPFRNASVAALFGVAVTLLAQHIKRQVTLSIALGLLIFLAIQLFFS